MDARHSVQLRRSLLGRISACAGMMEGEDDAGAGGCVAEAFVGTMRNR